jgi:hypothetical protein
MSAPVFYTAHTTCSGQLGEHTHTLPAGGYELTPYVTIHDPRGAVTTRKAENGRLVRYVGTLIYDPATRKTHVLHREGATSVEVQALVETATRSLLENPPSNWPKHPCEPLWNRTAVCRYVDDEFMEEAAEEYFTSFDDQQMTSVMAEWAASVVDA